MKSLMVCSVVLCGHVLLAGRASFKVMALDSETGQPIPNVKIEGSFLNYSPGWGIAAKNNDVDAWTDRNGVARLSGNTEKGVCGYRIYRTPGYYNAEWVEIAFSEQSFLKLGRWLPDDIVVTARLDRIINPIPLFVKPVRGIVDRTAKPKSEWDRSTHYADVFTTKGTTIAYDFVQGDWMPPWGGGVVPDVEFHYDRTVLGREPYRYPSGIHTNEFYRCDVQIRFIGAGNGMIESYSSVQSGIKLRIAPETGYVPERICWKGRFSRTEHRDNFDKNRCYSFRIRTRLDEDGNVKSACYGKIYGDFKLVDKKDGIKSVGFLYYLNPTPNDRNLEWDMKNNLCPNPGDIGNPRP